MNDKTVSILVVAAEGYAIRAAPTAPRWGSRRP